MRASSVVQAILDVLGNKNTHIPSREIYECIHDRLPAVNPSTVYRALERLTREGVISVSDMGTGSMVYELVTIKKHHHLVCQQCGRILNIDDHEIEPVFHRIETLSGYQMTTNHLVLFGICPSCRQVESTDESK